MAQNRRAAILRYDKTKRAAGPGRGSAAALCVVKREAYYFSSLASFSLRAASASRSPRVVFSNGALRAAGASSALGARVARLALRSAAFSARASSSKMRLWLRMMRLLSLLNSMTLNWRVSPALACVPSSLTRCLGVAKPSTPCSRATTAPLSNTSEMVPSWIEPTANSVSKASQGFSSSCLWPRLRRRFSLSIASTSTSMSAPI